MLLTVALARLGRSMVSSPMGSPSPNVLMADSPGGNLARRKLKAEDVAPKPATSASNNNILAYVSACTIYVAAGPILILLNNTILHEHRFPFPIALSALGVGFSALVSHTAFGLGILSFKQPQLKSNGFFWTRARFARDLLVMNALS